MKITRSDAQIDDLINECVESESTGESKYPGMTYEQGIKAMFDWLEGREQNPLDME